MNGVMRLAEVVVGPEVRGDRGLPGGRLHRMDVTRRRKLEDDLDTEIDRPLRRGTRSGTSQL